MNDFFSKANKLLLLLFLFLLAGVVVSRIIFPMDSGSYESVVWSAAELAIGGKNPYEYAFTEPFVMAPYGYLYYLLAGFGIKLFGTQFWFARLISVVAGGICCFSLIRISRLFSNEKIVSLTACVFFISSLPFLDMLAIQRPDLTALAFNAFAFTLIIGKLNGKSESGKRALIIIIAAVLCFGGIFVKQTFLLFPVFAGLWLLIHRQFKSAALFWAGGLVFTTAVILLLNQTSEGGYVWQHFVLTRNIPADYDKAAAMFTGLSLRPAIIIGFITVAAAVFSALRSSSDESNHRKRFLFFLFYFALAVGLAFFTSARAGSNVNYYLESIFIASIIFATALAQLAERRNCRIILTALLLCGFLQISKNIKGESARWRSYPYYAEIIETYNKNVPAEAVGIATYADLITAADRSYHFGDWIQYSDGRSAELNRVFIEAVKSKRYKAIIWHSSDSELLLSSGYRLISMKTPVPAKGLTPVYLYLLDK